VGKSISTSKDAIWMLLQNNGGIIDHIVEQEKTVLWLQGTEMKRTGVAKKPMILALKSTIPQIVPINNPIR
jgi:hypothetical protein